MEALEEEAEINAGGKEAEEGHEVRFKGAERKKMGSRWAETERRKSDVNFKQTVDV